MKNYLKTTEKIEIVKLINPEFTTQTARHLRRVASGKTKLKQPKINKFGGIK